MRKTLYALSRARMNGNGASGHPCRSPHFILTLRDKKSLTRNLHVVFAWSAETMVTNLGENVNQLSTASKNGRCRVSYALAKSKRKTIASFMASSFFAATFADAKMSSAVAKFRPCTNPTWVGSTTDGSSARSLVVKTLVKKVVVAVE